MTNRLFFGCLFLLGAAVFCSCVTGTAGGGRGSALDDPDDSDLPDGSDSLDGSDSGGDTDTDTDTDTDSDTDTDTDTDSDTDTDTDSDSDVDTETVDTETVDTETEDTDTGPEDTSGAISILLTDNTMQTLTQGLYSATQNTCYGHAGKFERATVDGTVIFKGTVYNLTNSTNYYPISLGTTSPITIEVTSGSVNIMCW